MVTARGRILPAAPAGGKAAAIKIQENKTGNRQQPPFSLMGHEVSKAEVEDHAVTAEGYTHPADKVCPCQ